MVNHVVVVTLHMTYPNHGRTHRQQAKYGVAIGEAERQSSPGCPGLWTALQGAMSLQQLGHANNQIVHGRLVDPAGAQVIRDDATVRR